MLREGLETALFLISTTTNDGGGGIVVGTLLGLAAATVLGVIVYQGAHTFNMRLFFQITGVLIIMFAAGLVSRAILFLQSSGDLGSWNLNGVYDLTRYDWLTQDTQSGRFLAGIFGWDPRPSIEQVIGYLAYLIPVLYLFFRKPRIGEGAGPAAVPVAEPRRSRARPPSADRPSDPQPEGPADHQPLDLAGALADLEDLGVAVVP